MFVLVQPTHNDDFKQKSSNKKIWLMIPAAAIINTGTVLYHLCIFLAIHMNLNHNIWPAAVSSSSSATAAWKKGVIENCQEMPNNCATSHIFVLHKTTYIHIYMYIDIKTMRGLPKGLPLVFPYYIATYIHTLLL